MAQIPPVSDSYIDEIIRSKGSYNPHMLKTQGVKLRELFKLLRDRLEQQAGGEQEVVTAPVGSRTFSLNDRGVCFIKTSWHTWSIPTNSSVPFPIGTEFTVILDHEWSNFFASPSGVNVITTDWTGRSGEHPLLRGAIIKFKKIALNSWHLDVAQGIADVAPEPPFAEREFIIENENGTPIVLEYYNFDRGEPDTIHIPAESGDSLNYKLPNSAMIYWFNVVSGCFYDLRYTFIKDSVLGSGRSCHFNLGYEIISGPGPVTLLITGDEHHE